jgi:hypothetical protein
MNNTGFKSVEQFICQQCRDIYKGIHTDDVGTSYERKQAKDIYHMQRESEEMEKSILSSLPPKRTNELAVWVVSVQELANRRAQQAVGDWAEQSILFNILMAEAWKAALSYDPTVAKFSTWVYRPWTYAIKEFIRIKRLHTQSLSCTCYFGNHTAIEDGLVDKETPLDCVKDKEWKEFTEDAFGSQIFWETIVEDVFHQQYEWLCPFCRRIFRELSLQHTTDTEVTVSQRSEWNVYDRRMLWARVLEDG